MGFSDKKDFKRLVVQRRNYTVTDSIPGAKALMDAAFPLFIISRDHYIHPNKAAIECFDLSPSVLKAEQIKGFDWSALQGDFNSALAGHSKRIEQFSISGENAQLSLSPLYDTNNHAVAVLCIAALHPKIKSIASENELLDSIDAAIYTCDKEGRIQYYNKAAAELWGREPELGKDLWCGSWKIYNPDGSELALNDCPMAIALKEGKTVKGREIVIERPDGTKRYIIPHPEPVFDKKGNITAAINLLTDITWKAEAEKALRESEERFRQLADFMPQLVWTANPEGVLEYCNKQWKEYGAESQNEYGPYLAPILHPDDVEYTQSTWSNAVKNGEPYEIAYRFRDKAEPGEYRWFLGRALPVKDADNKVIKWFGTSTDIHDSKMIAEELERRVAERTRDLNEAYNSLKRSNEELEQFAYVASHDLQEPLRKIKTFSSRILERSAETMDETCKGYFNKLIDSADRMAVLISDVLNYSMLNQIENDFVKTDLNSVLKRAQSDFDLAIQNKNVELRISELPKIDAISYQINQLFHNLFSNALKFSREGVQPLIEVFSQKLDRSETEALELDPLLNYHRITIRDNGIGFSEEYAEKIFVIFQRLNPRQKFSGTGIGLALCRKIVNLHKGIIYAESKLNCGSSFHIILPEEQHAKFQYHAPDALYFQAAGQY